MTERLAGYEKVQETLWEALELLALGLWIFLIC